MEVQKKQKGDIINDYPLQQTAVTGQKLVAFIVTNTAGPSHRTLKQIQDHKSRSWATCSHYVKDSPGYVINRHAQNCFKLLAFLNGIATSM